MVKSGNYHLEEKKVYSFSEIRNCYVFYRTGGIHKSKYCCYIAQPSMLRHNYVKFWQITTDIDY